MSLLGRVNWWLPAWLDRILPQVGLEPDLEAGSTEEPMRARRDAHMTPV
ncbi:hypothetical protein G3I15_40085 [Streptomyces sp. SID10244]|nr:hypothetical protein [Streptomyces sp. SID10244]